MRGGGKLIWADGNVNVIPIETQFEELVDYKFFCFHGKVKFFKVDFGRFVEHRANYYSTDGELLGFGEAACPPDYDYHVCLPQNLGEMVSLAERLSSGIPFLRCDFYNVNNKILFGELTFYPASGLGKWTTLEADEKIGTFIDLH